ncbi:hypothetical protein BDFG_07118 [Blastomyces dermatitidis ATCC 26199]|nr:hypothetical protein BDFG_07118 [Blastomyces dermatitidis ATCC 26199]
MPDPTVSEPYAQSAPRTTGLSLLVGVKYCALTFYCRTHIECAEQPDCREKANYDPTRIYCGRLFYPHQCVVRGSPDPHPITRFDGLAPAPTSSSSSAPEFAYTAAPRRA